MQKRDAIEKLIKTVLDGTELHFKVDSYTLEENFENGQAFVRCAVHDDKTGAKQIISGKGVGLIDAIFQGLIEKYSPEFPSLLTLRFAQFAVKANLDSGKDKARSDSPAEVTLSIANAENKEYFFVSNSTSLTRSSIDVVLQAVEFFINSERAFVQVYNALEYARKSNRPDSVQSYTSQLSTLVEATSYSSVIAHLKRSE